MNFNDLLFMRDLKRSELLLIRRLVFLAVKFFLWLFWIVPWAYLLVGSVNGFSDDISEVIGSLLFALVATALFTFMISSYIKYFRIINTFLTTHVHKRLFNLAVFFGVVFVLALLPFEIIPAFFLHIAEVQAIADNVQIFRLVLFFGAAIAHCVFLALSLRGLFPRRKILWLWICSGTFTLCSVWSIITWLGTLGNVEADTVVLTLFVPVLFISFHILLTLLFYCVVLAIVFRTVEQLSSDLKNKESGILLHILSPNLKKES